MGIEQQIDDKVRDYLEGDYEVRPYQGIPNIENVPFGKVALRIQMCAFAIDLRGSTELLDAHQKKTAGKIHKAFLYATAAIVNHYGGYIRNFRGDGLLAFWPADYKNQISKAVRAALALKYMLNQKLQSRFSEYSEIDFGIGIDWGEVYVLRVGVPRDPNDNDLVFIGKCVNYAVAISEQAKGPYHVEVSVETHHNLEDEVRYATDAGKQVDMWRDGTVKWKGEAHASRITSYYWAPAG
jgi:adenylate cyclase